MFPQAPQFSGSDGSSTQVLLQLVKPTLQTEPQQLPPSQPGLLAAKQIAVACSGASHVLSHSPHESSSVTVANAPGIGGSGRKFSHRFRHRVNPALQVNPQVPREQIGVALSGTEHALPQEPQF
jgi:hypothetical protein